MKHNPYEFYDSSCTDRGFDDYLLLGGGTDINPAIYGEKDHGYCQHPHKTRDTVNIKMINKYVEMGKPIFGICRGFQLLDAVFGGKLIQHTVGHTSYAKVYVINDESEPIPFGHPEVFMSYDNCRSCHHQMVDLDHTNGKLLGWSKYEVLCSLPDGGVEGRNIVPQILYWPDKKALAVQFHPEWHKKDHPMNEHLRGLLKNLLGLENVL